MVLQPGQIILYKNTVYVFPPFGRMGVRSIVPLFGSDPQKANLAGCRGDGSLMLARKLRCVWRDQSKLAWASCDRVGQRLLLFDEVSICPTSQDFFIAVRVNPLWSCLAKLVNSGACELSLRLC